MRKNNKISLQKWKTFAFKKIKFTIKIHSKNNQIYKKLTKKIIKSYLRKT